MKKLYLFFFLLSSGLVSVAQPAAIKIIAKNCAIADLKQNLRTLASAQMEGRLFASKVDTLAARYIANWFKQQQLQAPFDKGKSYFQTITAQQHVDRVMLKIDGQSYQELDGWQLYPHQPLQIKDASILALNYTTLADLLAALPQLNIKGKVLVLPGNLALAAFSINVDSLEQALQTKGASGLIWSGPSVTRVLARRQAAAFLPLYAQDSSISRSFSGLLFPEMAMTPRRLDTLLQPFGIRVDSSGNFNSLQKGALQVNLTLNLNFDRRVVNKNGPNVIGILPGTDPSLPHVLLSAHHDHDGRNGSTIYYGAVDNASGTVALMQMVAMFRQAAKQGLRPKRTIIFGSWTGEERGLLGSVWYARHPVKPLKDLRVVLNTDMLGRADTLHSGKSPDSLNYVYLMVKDLKNEGLRKAVEQANGQTKLVLDPYFENAKFERRMLMGSDHYSFFVKGIPFIDFNCGFCADYHQPTDTASKINYQLLTRQTQLAFLTAWNLAN